MEDNDDESFIDFKMGKKDVKMLKYKGDKYEFKILIHFDFETKISKIVEFTVRLHLWVVLKNHSF